MPATLPATVEAILYLKAKPLKLAEIADHAQCDRTEVEEALMQLMEDYAHRDSALEIVESSEGYCLQLRSSLQNLVKTLIPLDLGVGALRTLAAIALKGSISQTELVDLRGSGAYQQVQVLLEQGFIRKRRQKEGRSYWLQVTDKFHQYFQIDQLQLKQLKPKQSSQDTALPLEKYAQALESDAEQKSDKNEENAS
jgi:segregation and condensation protein B